MGSIAESLSESSTVSRLIDTYMKKSSSAKLHQAGKRLFLSKWPCRYNPNTSQVRTATLLTSEEKVIKPSDTIASALRHNVNIFLEMNRKEQEVHYRSFSQTNATLQVLTMNSNQTTKVGSNLFLWGLASVYLSGKLILHNSNKSRKVNIKLFFQYVVKKLTLYYNL